MAACVFVILYFEKKERNSGEKDLAENIISISFHKLVDNKKNKEHDYFLEHESSNAFYFELLERGGGGVFYQ